MPFTSVETRYIRPTPSRALTLAGENRAQVGEVGEVGVPEAPVAASAKAPIASSVAAVVNPAVRRCEDASGPIRG